MYKEAIKALTEKACASIRYRTRKEILEENPDIKDYLDEILNDRRVEYVLSWQRPNGFLGQILHGGRIPKVKGYTYSTATGAEGALRFLHEMGIPKTYPVVEKGLKALLKDNWINQDKSLIDKTNYQLRTTWLTLYKPEIGLFGPDHVRAVLFAYFGIEEHDFIQTEIKRAFGYVNKVTEISSIEGITGTYRDKPYFKGIPLPDIYNVELLAFTKSWRNNKNTNIIARALEKLIELSWPYIYIKFGSRLISPAIGTHYRDIKKAFMTSGQETGTYGFEPWSHLYG